MLLQRGARWPGGCSTVGCGRRGSSGSTGGGGGSSTGGSSTSGSSSSSSSSSRTRPLRPLLLAARSAQQQQQPQQPQQPGRRVMLQRGTAAAAAALLAAGARAPPAGASVTVTLKPRAQPKLYTLKSGCSVVVPDSWALAYDRSDSSELGTIAFFGNFRSFETLSVFKVAAPEGQLDAAALLEAVIAEQRDNQSTYGFTLLSGPAPTPRQPPLDEGGGPAGATYYDSEYELAICRGLIQEGSGGRRRCVGPNDMNLQVVSRHFVQTFVQPPGDGRFILVVRGSTTSDTWAEAGPAAVEAVRSFRLPGAAAA